jgi:transcriptional regulator with XRE-family HTH domain
MYPNLKLEIFRRGIQQNNVAKDLSINEANLSKIIRGYREPTESQRRQLAEYLQVDEAWLFERHEWSVRVDSLHTTRSETRRSKNRES